MALVVEALPGYLGVSDKGTQCLIGQGTRDLLRFVKKGHFLQFSFL